MTQTNYGSTAELRKIVFATDVLRQMEDQGFWFVNNLVGSGTADMSRPIHRVTEVTTTTRGTKYVMPFVSQLPLGSGVVGTATLTGNESSNYSDAQTINIDQLRNGVRSSGMIAEQATVIRFDVTAKNVLADWFTESWAIQATQVAAGQSFAYNTDGSVRGNSNWPSLAFASDISAPTSARKLFAGAATSTASLTTSDTMSMTVVNRAVTMARRQLLKPTKINGKDWYYLVMAPESLRDLQNSDAWRSAVSQGDLRGDTNHLFAGGTPTIYGAVILDSRHIPTTFGVTSGSKYGGSGTVDGSQALLLGAQSVGYAEVTQPKFESADDTDYKDKQGFSFGAIYGLKKMAFKDRNNNDTRQDYGVISVYHAVAQT